MSYGHRLEIHGCRRLVLERLMRALAVVERKVVAQAIPGFARVGIFGEVNLLVLDRAPQTLSENVVAASAAAIHADLHTGTKQQVGILRAGEVAALVAVPNRRHGLLEGTLGAVEHEADLERVGQLPGQHIAAPAASPAPPPREAH